MVWLFILLTLIAIAMIALLIFIICSCKVSSESDEKFYDETKLDDDVYMYNILDYLTYDDDFVKKEEEK